MDGHVLVLGPRIPVTSLAATLIALGLLVYVA